MCIVCNTVLYCYKRNVYITLLNNNNVVILNILTVPCVLGSLNLNGEKFANFTPPQKKKNHITDFSANTAYFYNRLKLSHRHPDFPSFFPSTSVSVCHTAISLFFTSNKLTKICSSPLIKSKLYELLQLFLSFPSY